MAKQVFVSTHSLIGKELSKAGNLERRFRNFGRNMRRLATSNSADPSKDLPRLNFSPAKAPSTTNLLDLEHSDIAHAENSEHDSDSSCDRSSAGSRPSHDPENFDLDTTTNADGDDKLERSRSIRHYFRRFWDTARPENLLFSPRKRGDILFVQQFLVQVRETQGGKRLQELKSIPASSVKDRFREYTAVARYTGKSDVPVVVYLYSTDEVTRKVDHRWSRALRHKIYVDTNTRAVFFDNKDLSIAVWNCHKRSKEDGGRVFFVFLSQSIPVQISWVYFFMHYAGYTLDPIIHLKIPELNISLQMRREGIDMDIIQAKEKDTVTYDDLLQSYASPSTFVQHLHHRALDVISECSDMRTNRKFMLCWRNIDFIRMILFEKNLHATAAHVLLRDYLLELRPVDTLTTEEEPSSIEGFCWRLTTWRGQGRKQTFTTRNYFHTHNHLLFYLSPTKTLLPNFGQGDEKDDELREYFENLPMICEIDPFPLDENNDIKWCVDEEATSESVKLHDGKALYEIARGASNIESSDGCVDMTEITGIRPLSNPLMFEISIADKYNVLIRVAESEARDEWVVRLEALVKYWTAMKDKLHQESIRVYEKNLAQNTNFILHANPESNFATPNMSSFNIESVLRTKPIIYSNYLYKKAHKHGFFRKYYAVLTSHSIVLFNCSGTSHSMSNPNVKYDTNFTADSVFDLLRSYVYSGVLAKDLLSRESEDSFDFAQMYNGIPRVFERSWVVKDREADCCFILWDNGRGKTRSKTRKAMYESKLVCMARSRIERDLWINAIQNVTTALAVVRDNPEQAPE